MSSQWRLNYLNDYINITLRDTDDALIESLNRSYFDEIEKHARFILAEWYSEQIIDTASSLYIKNVANLNRKIVSLTHTCQLNKKQIERIDSLLFHSETVQLVTSIIKSLFETNLRHQDPFLRYLSIFIDVFALTEHLKATFGAIAKQAVQSKYYKQYLTESLSATIQPIHAFFIGTIGQLALPLENTIFNEVYSQFLTTFYHEKHVSDNIDLHYCTLGIFSQLDISFLMNDYTCISALESILMNTSSSKNVNLHTTILLLPVLNLLNSLCIQSKTIACFLNTDRFISVLLSYVTDQYDYRLNAKACLLLGHIISEAQLGQFRITYKLTMKFMNLLDYSKQETENILLSLLSLVIHEQIQNTIANTYQLKYLIELCDSYKITYEIIWKLSFHSAILQQLVTRHDDFLKKLPSLSSKIPAAHGILQNIQIRKLPRLPKTHDISFDVALISSTKDHLIIEQFKKHLEKFGFRIGNAEKSLCVLLCVSEDAKHDCACQAAIQHALHSCQKIVLCIVRRWYRFDDWFATLNLRKQKLLNIIEFDVEKLRSEIQIDRQINHQLPAIIKQTRILTPEQNNDNMLAISHSTTLPILQATESPNVFTKRIQNWTNQEVLEWCGKNNLHAFTKILTLYDGRSLLALAHVSRISAPHTIINQLRNDCRKHGLRLSFVELVRFQAALDQLLRLERNIAKRQSISTLANRYVFKRTPTNKL